MPCLLVQIPSWALFFPPFIMTQPNCYYHNHGFCLITVPSEREFFFTIVFNWGMSKTIIIIISKTNPLEGKDYVTASISIFIKCGIWSLFANPVTYVVIYGKRVSVFLKD